MSVNGMKQMQGEKRADFIARCQAAQREVNEARAALLPKKKSRKAKRKHNDETFETRLDNLGESFD